MAEPLEAFSLHGWIEKHHDQFHKPVGNKVIWAASEFIAFVSGANSRNDFHVNPGDEIFFQLVGDVRVDLIDEHGTRVIQRVEEGDVLLVPAGVPHAPRRPAGTYGFVVERPRREGELDAFQWRCETCNTLLHTVSFQLEDIVTQFAEFLREFDADVAARTCGECGAVLDVHSDFTMDSQIVPGARTA